MPKRSRPTMIACNVFPALEEAGQSRHRAVILALDHCQIMLEERPQEADLLCQQAVLLERLGRYDEALASLDPAWNSRRRISRR
jgi:hypothetical protein